MDRTGHFGGQKALKTDAHFASIFGPFPGSFSLISQAVTLYTITGRKFYCQNQKKFLEVPEKISRCSMKSFGLCHEIISPVILKSFGLSQDLPLSQNGQKFRRGKKSQKGKGVDGANEPTGANGPHRRWTETTDKNKQKRISCGGNSLLFCVI